MGSVRGQTLLITGRVDASFSTSSPRAGPSAACSSRTCSRRPSDADVNLIVLQATSTPRQPGGRNWLWQKVEVQGLEEALQRARLADFLNALGGPSAASPSWPLPVGERTILDLRPIADLPGAVSSGRSATSLPTSSPDLAGRVVATTVLANVRSAARQQELDQRMLPGISTDVQLAYLVLLVLGLLGVPVSRIWWQRLWPPEQAAEYAGARRLLGRARRARPGLRAGVPAADCRRRRALQPGRQVRDAVTAPARLWRWLTGPAGRARSHAKRAPRARRRLR